MANKVPFSSPHNQISNPDPVWTEHISSKGSPYFYNRITGRSVWEKPPCSKPPSDETANNIIMNLPKRRGAAVGEKVPSVHKELNFALTVPQKDKKSVSSLEHIEEKMLRNRSPSRGSSSSSSHFKVNLHNQHNSPAPGKNHFDTTSSNLNGVDDCGSEGSEFQEPFHVEMKEGMFKAVKIMTNNSFFSLHPGACEFIHCEITDTHFRFKAARDAVSVKRKTPKKIDRRAKLSLEEYRRRRKANERPVPKIKVSNPMFASKSRPFLSTKTSSPTVATKSTVLSKSSGKENKSPGSSDKTTKKLMPH